MMRSYLYALLVPLVLLTPNLLLAQQAEIPPAAEQPADQADGSRIVDGRPRLQTIKRAGHPVSWIEAGFRPILRLAAKAAPKNDDSEAKPPKVSGIKFGAKGFGEGSGFGPEVKLFHKDLFGRGIEVEVPFAVTYKRYQSAGFRVDFPLLPVAQGGTESRFGFEVNGRYLSRAADAFYGIGNDSSLSDLSRFRTVSRTAGAALNARIAGAWSVRAGTGFRSVGITRPRTSRPASEVFVAEDVPGLTSGATFLDSAASIQRDTRDNDQLPDRGGLQRVEVSLNEGLRGGDFSYWRYRAELQQLIPLGERKAFHLRADVETNQPKGGSLIPFYDLPTLGSRSTVRGFQTRRFTDRSAMSASAEYRFRIWRYFDWGLFVDGGQVAPEIGNFALKNMHVGYGTRFIARTTGSKERRFFAFDVGRSREGWRFYVDFGGVF
jgi:outer membrane protein assembly factor BamA